MGMMGRKMGRRGEALLPVEEARREEYNRHRLLDHSTVVHKVGETQTCRVFFVCLFFICDVDIQLDTFVFSGSQERKLQRRSVRSRSESERGTDPVPKKKTKKEQVLVSIPK